MRKLSYIFIAIGLTVLRASAHDFVPGVLPDGPVALVNATVHPVSSTSVEGATLLFEDGQILEIGTSVTIPGNAERIDLSGKHVYPGLISPNSSIGLIEIDAARATRDLSEIGQLNPNTRAESALNPDSELIPVTRANGVLLAHAAPMARDKGLIAGTSAMVALDGWTQVDMTLEAPVAMVVNWPEAPTAPRQDHSRGVAHDTSKHEEAYREQIERLEKAVADARAYWKAKRAGSGQIDVDLRWEAMEPVLDGSLPLMVRASTLRQINDAVAWSERENLRIILMDAKDAWRVADRLAEKQIPVIIGYVNDLPLRRWESYDTSYRNAAILHDAGVLFAIGFGERGGNMGIEKTLPYEAAKAVAFGLPAEEALKSITLNPARILGIDERVGSLEVGKDATLIVTNGDPLDIRTQVESAFIGGRPVDLSSRHTQLHEKYRMKYSRE